MLHYTFNQFQFCYRIQNTLSRLSNKLILRLCVCAFFFSKLIYLFIFGCVGSLLLRTGFLQLRRAGATLRCGARASHCSGFSCCGARALGAPASVVVATRAQQLWLAGSRANAQQLWCTGLVAPRHVGSSQTRARTPVPCFGRRILNHCATREVHTLGIFMFSWQISLFILM